MKEILIGWWAKIVHCFGVLLGWLRAGWCFVTRHLGCGHCTGGAVKKTRKRAKRKPAKRKRSTKK